MVRLSSMELPVLRVTLVTSRFQTHQHPESLLVENLTVVRLYECFPETGPLLRENRLEWYNELVFKVAVLYEDPQRGGHPTQPCQNRTPSPRNAEASRNSSIARASRPAL